MDIQDMIREQISRQNAMKEEQIKRLLKYAGIEYEDLEKRGYRIVMEIRPVLGVEESRVLLTKVIVTDVVHFKTDPEFRII